MDRVKIVVEAQDSASDDFQKIGAAAQKMGQQVTAAGKAASSGLKPVGTESKAMGEALQRAARQAEAADRVIARAGKSATQAGKDFESGARGVDRFEKNATRVGAGLGSLVTGLAVVGRAAVDQERQIAGVQRAYGEAGDQILAFTEHIQESTIFSNDAARQSALAAQSLAANYGLTADQIQQVVTVSADLASVYGIDLLDATTRVAGAIRGEGEAAELLGLNLSDSAVAAQAAARGFDTYATSATESEKAAFRMILVNEQAAFAQGAAGDAAETAAGQTRQFLNEIQDSTAGLGAFIGPAAEAASVLGSFALAAPLAGAAVGKMAGVAVGAAGASGLGGLAVAIGGVGLAAGAAIVPLAAFTAIMIKGAEERAGDFVGDFETQMTRMRALGIEANEEAKRVFDFVRTFNGTGAMVDGQIQGLNDSFDELLQLADPYLATLLSQAAGMELNASTSSALADEIQRLFTLQEQGNAVAYSYAQQELYLGTQTEAYASAVAQTIVAEERLLSVRQRQMAQRIADTNQMAGPNRAGIVDPSSEFAGLEDYDAAVARSVALQERMTQVGDTSAAAILGFKQEIAATAVALSEANQGLVAFVADSENIVDVLIRAGGALTGNQGFLRGVRDLADAQGALDSTFDAIIGGANALGQSGQQVADWASELTGITFDGSTFVYEVAAIDAALTSGRISQEEYNAAVTAGEDILYNNATIQADLVAIQAQQAPLIADRTNAYQDQIAALAALEPAEQRHALLMMDSGVQAQVASAYSTAYAASLGEIPEEVASELILAEAASNPDLAALLDELGLIERGADGTVKVNFPDGESMTQTLGTLNETLEDLVDIIAEVNGLTISPKVDPAAQSALEAFTKGIAAAPSAYADNAAAGPVGPVQPLGSRYSEPIVIPVELSQESLDAQIADLERRTAALSLDINTDAATASVAAVDSQLTDLAGGEYTVALTADETGVRATVSDAEGQIVALVNGNFIVPINADGSLANKESIAVEGAIQAVVNGRYVAVINGDGSGAQSEINSVNAALNYLNGTTGVIYVQGDGSGARGVINSLTGYQGSAYIIVDAVQGVGPRSLGLRDGGVVPYENGGVVGYDAAALDGIVTRNGMRRIKVGEAGAEFLNVPPGSSVIPAPMTRAIEGREGNGGGNHYHFHIAGSVVTMRQIAEDVSDFIIPAFAQGMSDHRAAHGAER